MLRGGMTGKIDMTGKIGRRGGGALSLLRPPRTVPDLHPEAATGTLHEGRSACLPRTRNAPHLCLHLKCSAGVDMPPSPPPPTAGHPHQNLKDLKDHRPGPSEPSTLKPKP